MCTYILRDRSKLLRLKLTKLFPNENFSSEKDSGKVLIIIIIPFLTIIIAITWITCLPIVPKLSQSEIADKFSVKSNYYAIMARVTDRAESCKKPWLPQLSMQHHMSICDHATSRRFTTAQNKGTEQVVYPVVVVEVNGIKCQALLDTGAGSSYASLAIRNKLLFEEFKCIEMMLRSAHKVISIFGVTIGSLDRKFWLKTEVMKVDRGTLVSPDNPRYAVMLEKYPYLDGVHMNDQDDKTELPEHFFLGASKYTQIKTTTKPMIGHPGEPVVALSLDGRSCHRQKKLTFLTCS